MSDRSPGVPNEHELDPEMALGADESSDEPLLESIEDPEHQDFVVPASDAVPAPEDVEQ